MSASSNLSTFESDGLLTLRHIEAFKRKGFVTIEKPIVSDAEAEIVRSTIARLQDRKAGWNEGAQYDLVGSNVDQSSAQAIPQILEPSNFAPELRLLKYKKTALEIARRLLGPEAMLCYEHAIVKPAFGTAVTPWHQDIAYRTDPGFEYRQLSIWLALQDVDLRNGCMQYLPTSADATVLLHGPAGGDPTVPALECIGEFDASLAEACPLPKGGVSIHGGATLHFTGPNLTDTSRYAYILEFELPPKPLANMIELPHPQSRAAAAKLRRRAWMLQGGYFVFLARKVRYGSLWRRGGFRYALSRVVRYIFKV